MSSAQDLPKKKILLNVLAITQNVYPPKRAGWLALTPEVELFSVQRSS
jgi:hypothetical protein